LTGRTRDAGGGVDLGFIQALGGLAGGVVGAAAGGSIGGAIFDKPLPPTARGRASETRVIRDLGLEKNTDPVTTQEGTAIPDIMNDTEVADVKDVKTVSNTKQMRIERAAAQQRGVPHNIYTGNNTKVRPTVPRAGSTIIRRPDLGPGARTSGRFGGRNGVPAVQTHPCGQGPRLSDSE
jgi:hypothetical protein